MSDSGDDFRAMRERRRQERRKWMKCDDCDGRGYTKGVKCTTCGGAGEIYIGPPRPSGEGK